MEITLSGFKIWFETTTVPTAPSITTIDPTKFKKTPTTATATTAPGAAGAKPTANTGTAAGTTTPAPAANTGTAASRAIGSAPAANTSTAAPGGTIPEKPWWGWRPGPVNVDREGTIKAEPVDPEETGMASKFGNFAQQGATTLAGSMASKLGTLPGEMGQSSLHDSPFHIVDKKASSLYKVTADKAKTQNDVMKSMELYAKQGLGMKNKGRIVKTEPGDPQNTYYIGYKD